MVCIIRFGSSWNGSLADLYLGLLYILQRVISFLKQFVDVDFHLDLCFIIFAEYR